MIITRRSSMLGIAAATLTPFALTRSAFAQAGGDYAARALEGGMFLKMTSQMALEKSETAMIREFAELEVAEQTTVAEILESTGATAPTEMKAAHAEVIESLRAASGSQFDLAYLEAQTTGHREALAVHQAMAEMSEITVPVATAKLAAGHIKSHLAMLAVIGTMMG